jgi:hypothetical protein
VQNGVPRGTIPMACLREFVDEEIGRAKVKFEAEKNRSKV